MICFIAVAVFFSFAIKAEEGSLLVPKQLSAVDIKNKLGTRIPFDVDLVDHNGHALKLGDYFKTESSLPVVLTLSYYRCSMLCDLSLKGLINSIGKLPLKLGRDFRVLSISIDEKENHALALTKRNFCLKKLGNKFNDNGWRFHVGEVDGVKKLANSVGFKYEFDKKSGEYAHAAAIFVISPKGVLSRVLFGIEYNSIDLKLALIDASTGNVGNLWDYVLLSCFHYNPDSHRYGVYILGIVRALCVLTVLLLVFYFWMVQWKK